MKIKTDFVTNSSSTCYIFDKRKLTKKELQVIRQAGAGLETPEGCGLGRSSAYGEGESVVAFVNELKTSRWLVVLADQIQKHIDQIGVDYVIFARDSDEGMGGYFLDYSPEEYLDSEGRIIGGKTGVNKLLGKAISVFEYH